MNLTDKRGNRIGEGERVRDMRNIHKSINNVKQA